jgi:FixJ family two-component response regulator
MNKTVPVIHVVDDDPSSLVALGRLLKASGYSVRTYASGAEFLAKLGDGAGCVVTDLRMPGMDGLDLQQALVRGANMLPVVFLSGEGDIPTTVMAMRQGAEDFLTKRAPKEAIFAAVDRAIARDARQRAEGAHSHALRSRFDALTSRELEILRHVVAGQINKQIATDLGISERTVKFHRTAITTKLQVHSAAELTRLALAAGLFDGTPADLP